jgi:hypothetical protein
LTGPGEPRRHQSIVQGFHYRVQTTVGNHLLRLATYAKSKLPFLPKRTVNGPGKIITLVFPRPGDYIVTLHYSVWTLGFSDRVQVVGPPDPGALTDEERTAGSVFEGLFERAAERQKQRDRALPAADQLSLSRLQQSFLALLPRIEAHARVMFRWIRCAHRRDDLVAEAVAIAWKWHLGLARRGKDPRTFAATFATFATRQVRSGRRLCGQEAGKDALSPLAQTRDGFVTGKLPDYSTLSANPLTEALQDHPQPGARLGGVSPRLPRLAGPAFGEGPAGGREPHAR